MVILFALFIPIRLICARVKKTRLQDLEFSDPVIQKLVEGNPHLSADVTKSTGSCLQLQSTAGFMSNNQDLTPGHILGLF